MTAEMPTAAQMEEALMRVQLIKRFLKGLHPGLQGFILAELMALWISGHYAGNGEHAALREKVLQYHTDMVRERLAILVKHKPDPVH